MKAWDPEVKAWDPEEMTWDPEERAGVGDRTRTTVVPGLASPWGLSSCAVTLPMTAELVRAGRIRAFWMILAWRRELEELTSGEEEEEGREEEDWGVTAVDILTSGGMGRRPEVGVGVWIPWVAAEMLDVWRTGEERVGGREKPLWDCRERWRA